MNKIKRSMYIFVSLILCLVLCLETSPALSQVEDPAFSRSGEKNQIAPETQEPLQYGILNSGKLWIAMGKALFVSENQGQRWRDVSPKTSLFELNQFALFENGKGRIVSVSPAVDSPQAVVMWNERLDDGWAAVESNLSFVLSENHATHIESIFVQWLNENEGWLLAKQGTSSNFSVGVLLHTRNGGKHWSALPSPAGEAFVFLNEQLGFMRQHSRNDAFYYTIDGGRNWQVYELSKVLIQDSQLEVGLPVNLSAGGFLLPIELGFDDNSRQIGFYFSQNKSIADVFEGSFNVVAHRVVESANQLHSPQYINQTALDLFLDIQSLQFVNQKQGLAMFSNGTCFDSNRERICRAVKELRLTEDGGQTWKNIRLPNGERNQITTFQTSAAVSDDPMPPKGDLVGSYTGQAFDAAEVPTLPQLETWFNKSPYRAVNLYIGGISRYGENENLSKDYINQIAQQGWRLIPTWVGYQAPCTTFRHKFPYNVQQAYEYGVQDATQAKARMLEYGLLDSSEKGGLVYLDLEHFDITNASCMAAVQSFLTGWTTKMSEFQVMGGLYATSSSMTRGQFYHLQPPPPAAWIAEWRASSGYYPDASPYGLKHISDEYWNKKRIRQYSGAANQTWGNVTLNVDSNVADGLVMKKTDLPPTNPVVYANIYGTKGVEPYYISQVNVIISAYDYSVGIDKVYFRIDSGLWREYVPFGVNGSGLKTVSFYAINNAGLYSDVKTISFYVNNQGPINPTVKSNGCGGLVDGVPQNYCNDANFVLNPGFDAGAGLHPTETYQYYWGTNPQGINENTSTTLLELNPSPVPVRVPHYLRVRTQDLNHKWSAWQTIFTLIYDPDYTEMITFPLLFK